MKKISIDQVKVGDTVRYYNHAHSGWRTEIVGSIGRHNNCYVLYVGKLALPNKPAFYRDTANSANELYVL